MKTPTEPAHDVTLREIDWAAEVRKLWGPQWNEPHVEYTFSNGREFKRRTEDVYNP